MRLSYPMRLKTNETWVIYTVATAVAFCAISYELLLANYATFLLGATIFQYALVITFMVASVGMGSLLVQMRKARTHHLFLSVAIVLAWTVLLGVPSLYSIFATQAGTRAALLLFVGLTGLGLGMEILLLNSMLPHAGTTRILFYVYFAGFISGIAFPLFLLPPLGFFRISGIVSLLNTGVGLLFFIHCRGKFRKSKNLFLGLLLLTAISGGTFLYFAEDLRHWMELKLFGIHTLPTLP